MYHLDGTSLDTGAAVRAFVVVDGGVEVGDGDSALGALLLTDLAADTAVLAAELGLLAVRGGGAQYLDVLVERAYLDELIRADCHALSARSAKERYHLGYAVFKLDSITVTGCETVSETDTAVLA